MKNKDKESYWDVGFFILLLISWFYVSISLNCFEANESLKEELLESKNNSRLWERSAEKTLDAHLEVIYSQTDNMWANCEKDCYRFQLDWGYSDSKYCNDYCENKYNVNFGGRIR